MVTCHDPFIIDERSLKNQKIEKSNTRKSKKDKEKWNFAENVPLETKVKTAQLLVKEINKAALVSMMDAANQVFFICVDLRYPWTRHGRSNAGNSTNSIPALHGFSAFPEAFSASFFSFPSNSVLIRSPTRTILSEFLSPYPWNRPDESRKSLTNNSVCEPCVGCSTGCSCADGECFCVNK